jgi:hypothetical protein
MKSVGLPQDPLWPRANILFDGSAAAADFALLGIPAHQTSISATSAHLTPAAGSKLLCNIRIAASCAHPLAVIDDPVAA